MLPQSKLSTGKFPKEITVFLLALQKSHVKFSTFTEQYLQAFNGRKPTEKTKRQSCQFATAYGTASARASACSVRMRFR
jgi:hypothetical protein